MNLKSVQKVLSFVLIGMIVFSAGIIVFNAMHSNPMGAITRNGMMGNGNFNGNMPNWQNGTGNPNSTPNGNGNAAANGNGKQAANGGGNAGTRFNRGTGNNSTGTGGASNLASMEKSISRYNMAGTIIYVLAGAQIAAGIGGLIYLYTRRANQQSLPYDDDEDDDDEDDDDENE